MNITCIKTEKSKRNGAFAIVYDFKSWPGNSLKMRGWLNAKKVYTRPATILEEQEAKQASRLLSYRYKSWEEVVADEAKYGIDANLIANNVLQRT